MNFKGFYSLRFKGHVIRCADDLVKLGYCQFTVEDFRDVLVDILDQLVSMNNIQDLEKIFRDQHLQSDRFDELKF